MTSGKKRYQNMKKTATILITAIMAGSISSAKDISGRVLCEGKGVAGVVVSDGTGTVITDVDGKYTIDTDEDATFVFISTPAGYSSPVKDNTVDFFLPVSEKNDGYDFLLSRKKSDDRRHNLVVISDQQVYDSTEFPLLEAAAEDIAGTVRESLPVETVGICCGDIVSFDHPLYGKINRIMNRSGVTFRNIPGNHDMKNWGRSHETSTAEFEKVYGPAYYSFNVGDIHYVMLNDNFFIGRDYFYIGYLDEKQLRWLEQDLSYIPEGTTVFVALHIPTTLSPKDRERFDYSEISTRLANKKALYDILSPYNAQIISGHMHTSTNQIVGPGIFEHNIAALSGAWWCGTICTDGTPAGYKVFRISGNSITWKYKSTGYGTDFQMKVYSPDDYTELGGYVVANVWDYDPQWKVEYFENGIKICDMEQFEGTDPQAVTAYSDRSRLKHSYVYPTKTQHLFRAKPECPGSPAEVRVTDRFGNTYSCKVKISE